MNYDLSEEQKILKDAAHRFLAEACPSTFVREMAEDDRGFTEELWQRMAELGWMGLPFPEAYGGADMDFLDLAILLTEMGTFCLPGPYFSTVVLAGLTVLDAGTEDQKAAILPGLAAGERRLTLAWMEEEGTSDLEAIRLAAEPAEDGFLLSGTKLFVPDAHVADTILCAARTGNGPDGISLFVVDGKDPGIRVTLLKTLAGDKQCEVVFDRVRVRKSDILGQAGEGGLILKRTLLRAAVGKCAEMVGGAQRVMDLAVAYAKERVQFGRPIGAFQAVQHHCADMLTYADTIRFITYNAAWKIAKGLPFEKDASMCKAWSSEAYRRLVALGHQVLGGIGFTEEHDLHLYFRRAKAGELMFGDADFHREEIARAMDL